MAWLSAFTCVLVTFGVCVGVLVRDWWAARRLQAEKQWQPRSDPLEGRQHSRPVPPALAASALLMQPLRRPALEPSPAAVPAPETVEPQPQTLDIPVQNGWEF